MNKRINFIDVARTLAICMVLISHGMTPLGGWSAFEGALILKIFTRSATPLFILMFGIMMEVVYYPRVKKYGLRIVTKQLLIRSFQCYLGYAVTAIACVLGGLIEPEDGLRALGFLENIRYSNLLRFYSIALLGAPIFLWIRARFHPLLILSIIPLIWGIEYSILERFNGYDFGKWNSLMCQVFGAGICEKGPSVWHGSTFTIAGLLLGRVLKYEHPGDYLKFRKTAHWLLGITSLITFLLIIQSGVINVGMSFFGKTYRVSNHFGYFSIGLTASISILYVLAYTVPKVSLPEWTIIPLKFGRSSLLAFTIGNVLLCVIPDSFRDAGMGLWALALVALYMLIVLVLINFKYFYASITLKMGGGISMTK